MTAASRRLNVWIGHRLIGWLDHTRSGVRFTYEPGTVERVGLGRPLISMSMPTSNRPYIDRVARAFFDGLLPEGEARRIIAYDLRLPEADTFGLLRALGRDCAGALSLIGDGEAPSVTQPITTLPPLSADSLHTLIRNLRFNPLGVDDNVRVSLAGVQEKLVLAALPGGRWALPTASVASTHILKPAVPELTDGARNEVLCLRFAAHCGVPAAAATVDRLGGRDVLVVERFDRVVGVDGVVSRLHQETACQALAVPVGATVRKYEDAGGPSLRAIATVLRRWAGPEQLEFLLQQLTVNMMVGNADAHAVNTSFMIDDDGGVRISPMYDVFSTLVYPPLTTTPGMFVNGLRDIRLVTRSDLVAEAITWGMPDSRAAAVVAAVCDRAETAVEQAAIEEPDTPRSVVDLLARRVRTFTPAGPGLAARV